MAGIAVNTDSDRVEKENNEELESLVSKNEPPTCEKILLHKNAADLPSEATPNLQSASPRSETSDRGDSSPTRVAELMRTGPKGRRRLGSSCNSQRVTMTGTVTRGNGVGQAVEVRLALTETEYQRLTSREAHTKEDHKLGKCGPTSGPHIILWSVLCMPVAMVISLCIAFYQGSMTWYNFIIYFSEEKSFIHKLTICPPLILSFPLTVGLSALVISLMASVMQVSWSWQKWLQEVHDGEKGFYGWFCGKVGLPDCSPYQVVVLNGGF